MDIAVTTEIQKTIKKFSISIPKYIVKVSPIIKKIGIKKKIYKKRKFNLRAVLSSLSYCLSINFDKYSKWVGKKS